MNSHFENIEKICALKIKHRNWQVAVAESFALLTVLRPGEVLCITGPSRAGKTRLIDELKYLLCGEDKFDETGLMPAVVVDTDNTGPNGTFSTKEFTRRMLDAVRHPILSIVDERIEDTIAFQKFERTTEAVLRRSLESAFRRRKTRYLFIDEAQHARYTTRGAQGPFAVMDSWKCLAKAAQLVLIVVGAYPILDILHNSPHLLGRKYQVHFPRYQAIPEDLEEFARILAAFDPLVEKDGSLSSLLDQAELLYSGSFGCIGLLQKWLLAASALGMARSCPVSVDILREARPPKTELESIAAEILEGERYLAHGDFTLAENTGKQSSPASAYKRTRKPFQRNPKRLKPKNRTVAGG